MRNQTPMMTAAQGQYCSISSVGPWPSRPVVLSNRRMPTTIQATGQVNAQMPAMPGRQVRSVLMNVATPTRITHIGHAWLHDQPDDCWTRKMTPIPMSHVAPVTEPLRAEVMTGVRRRSSTPSARIEVEGRGVAADREVDERAGARRRPLPDRPGLGEAAVVEVRREGELLVGRDPQP